MIQPILSSLAVYFVVWWITLFAILPIGMRTQEENNDITLGTVASAPASFRGLKVALLTTLVSGLIYGTWLVCSLYLGFNLDSLPSVVPSFQ